MITDNQLKKILPQSSAENREKYLPYLNEYMPKYGIESFEQQASFLAQIGHESGQLSRVSENLNYSAEGLRNTFKKYFPNDEVANKYARKPEMIANKVYAGRMGNGDEASGDGWKYRGRGLNQITGKDNYKFISNGIGVDVVSKPELLENPKYAVEASCYWWKQKGLNELSKRPV